jgi:hypothetical protein
LNETFFSLSKVVGESKDYAQAYQALFDEVNALVDRNVLAEEEAQKLIKFNAELLSRKNPAQEILYVDRIRQELTDTKQVRQSNDPVVLILTVVPSGNFCL